MRIVYDRQQFCNIQHILSCCADESSHDETKPSTESPNQTSQTVPGTVVSIASTNENKEQEVATQPDTSKAEVQPAPIVKRKCPYLVYSLYILVHL